MPVSSTDKGAELFAKRRKRSEKWIVDETSRSANNPTATSYSAGPAQIYDTNQLNQENQTNQYKQSSYIDQVSVLIHESIHSAQPMALCMNVLQTMTK